MTLLRWKSADKVYVCDNRCHYSNHKRCRCLCRGIFHRAMLTPRGLDYVIRDRGPWLIRVLEPGGIDVSGLKKELERIRAAEAVHA